MKRLKNIIIVFLILATSFLYYQYKSSRDKLNISLINNKAYQMELEDLTQRNTQFTLDMATLRSFNDSISTNLKQALKQLKIKDKRIQQLQYLEYQTSRNDTIILKDTIFTPNVQIDTLIVDPYYQLQMRLKYPNYIEVNPQFNNKISTVVHSSREYVKPRKKYWIQRIFQKKHTVTVVDVIIDNPYAKNPKQRFIKIVK